MPELSKAQGVRHAAFEAFDEIFKAAIAAGRAQDDFAVLSEFMRA